MYGPNWASASATLNRHKFTGFEGGIRVPAFVHLPEEGWSPGRSSDAVGAVVDLLHIPRAGRRGASRRQLSRQAVLRPQGVSLLPVIWAGAVPHTAGRNPGLGALRAWRRRARATEAGVGWASLLPRSAESALFNRGGDQELRDLSNSNPQQVSKLQAAWDAYAQRNGVVF